MAPLNGNHDRPNPPDGQYADRGIPDEAREAARQTLGVWEARARDTYLTYRVAWLRFTYARDAWLIANADLTLARHTADARGGELREFAPVPFLVAGAEA